MYNKILLILTISFLSVSVFARENRYDNDNNNKNYITLGFGSTIARIYSVDNTGNHRIKELEPKMNYSLIYLRNLDVLDNKLSMGLDLQTIFSDRVDEKNGTIHSEVHYTIPLVATYLIDYKLMQIDNFNVSSQIGLGVAMNKYSNKYSDSKNGDSYSMKDSTYTPAFKVGLLANYDITDSIGVGLGMHYINIGKAKFEKDGNKAEFKNNGILNTNLNLTYKF